MFHYLESTGTWELVPEALGEAQDAAEVLWTGKFAIVRGTIDCGPCSPPFTPENTDLCNPSTNTWTAVRQDPLGGQGMASAWTGAALVSLDTDFTSSGPSGMVVPGDASVYDPVSGRWGLLPAAPSTCLCRRAPGVDRSVGDPLLLLSTAGGSAGLVFTAAAPSTGTVSAGSTHAKASRSPEAPGTLPAPSSSSRAASTGGRRGPEPRRSSCRRMWSRANPSASIRRTRSRFRQGATSWSPTSPRRRT